MPPTMDSTNNCPLFGINEVLPASKRTIRIINNEMTQLVIIELVTGKPRISNAFSAVRLTPSFPAAERVWEVIYRRKKWASSFNSTNTISTD